MVESLTSNFFFSCFPNFIETQGSVLDLRESVWPTLALYFLTEISCLDEMQLRPHGLQSLMLPPWSLMSFVIPALFQGLQKSRLTKLQRFVYKSSNELKSGV